jgi:plasmid stability protein
MLPDDLDARLRLAARRRGVSVAQVARDAIERELPS